jgi:hypothetical protein
MDWFLERLIVIASQASNRVCRETCTVCGSRAELSTSVASFTKGCELKVGPAQITEDALHLKAIQGCIRLTDQDVLDCEDHSHEHQANYEHRPQRSTITRQRRDCSGTGRARAD